MHFAFSKQFFADVELLKSEQPKLLAKIFELIEDAGNTPFHGKGKPEPLRGNLAGYWSRRISDKHRLIYFCEGSIIQVVSCYGHYDDK